MTRLEFNRRLESGEISPNVKYRVMRWKLLSDIDNPPPSLTIYEEIFVDDPPGSIDQQDSDFRVAMPGCRFLHSRDSDGALWWYGDETDE